MFQDFTTVNGRTVRRDRIVEYIDNNIAGGAMNDGSSATVRQILGKFRLSVASQGTGTDFQKIRKILDRRLQNHRRKAWMDVARVLKFVLIYFLCFCR